MPTWLLVLGLGTPAAEPAGATRYVPPSSSLLMQTTEAKAQVIARDSYTLADLYVRVIANATTASSTVRSRVGGANGNQSVSIGAGATGVFQDTVNSDSLVDGNLFNSQVVVGAGGTLKVSIIAYTLATAANTTPILVSHWPYTIAFGQTRYAPPVGAVDFTTTTEARTQYTFRTAATLSNLRVYLSMNLNNGSSTFRTRVNGVNGDQSVTVPASTTGAFEDTTNTDSISPGDPVNLQAVTGGTLGNMTINIAQMKSNSARRQVAATSCLSVTLAANLTRFLPVEGFSQWYATVEADSQVAALTPFTARNMFVNVPTNSVDGASVFTMRKNGANGNLTVTVPDSTTGTFEDTTHTDTFIETDTLSWQIVTGGTAGTMEITAVGFELEQPAAGPAGIAKVNEVASANIGKVNSVAWASIAKINEVG